jgi:hypothetical protein
MKRVVPLFAMLCLCASGAWADASATLTTLHAAAALNNDEASKHPPVVFEGTVTYYHSHDGTSLCRTATTRSLFLLPEPCKLAPGDRILVRGTMHESFRPFVIGSDVTVVGHGPLPKPLQPSFEQMIRAETDCKLVTVRGVIRSADLEPDDPTATLRFTFLRMLLDGGPRGDRR